MYTNTRIGPNRFPYESDSFLPTWITSIYFEIRESLALKKSLLKSIVTPSLMIPCKQIISNLWDYGLPEAYNDNPLFKENDWQYFGNRFLAHKAHGYRKFLMYLKLIDQLFQMMSSSPQENWDWGTSSPRFSKNFGGIYSRVPKNCSLFSFGSLNRLGFLPC